MNNNIIIQKWESLFASLNKSEKSDLVCSLTELEAVEKEIEFRFPIGYKEFCQVFGSGCFDDFMVFIAHVLYLTNLI